MTNMVEAFHRVTSAASRYQSEPEKLGDAIYEYGKAAAVEELKYIAKFLKPSAALGLIIERINRLEA